MNLLPIELLEINLMQFESKYKYNIDTDIASITIRALNVTQFNQLFSSC